ncbi:MAG: hypothetical protein JOS17DRAFT_244148 [Linnemannia elongata]|nr:MAG: hypothetical protein JOS17DRAFT_244148 [Linnemannia elongata]
MAPSRNSHLHTILVAMDIIIAVWSGTFCSNSQTPSHPQRPLYDIFFHLCKIQLSEHAGARGVNDGVDYWPECVLLSYLLSRFLCIRTPHTVASSLFSSMAMRDRTRDSAPISNHKHASTSTVQLFVCCLRLISI